MSDGKSALMGSFADFKLIRGRKVAQVIVEVPIEQADLALSVLGGLPQPHTERWIALARLNPSVATDQGEEEPVSRPSSPATRQAWQDMKPSQQSALRCRDRAFIDWLGMGGSDETAMRVREICGVTSRKELDTNHASRVLWHQLDRHFMEATGRLAVSR